MMKVISPYDNCYEAKQPKLERQPPPETPGIYANSETDARYPLLPSGAVGSWLALGVLTEPIPQRWLARIFPDNTSAFRKTGRWVLNYWAWSEPSRRVKRRLQRRQKLTYHYPPSLDHAWRYVRVGEDEVVDFSRFNFNPTIMQGWTHARIVAQRDAEARAELLTIGPARVYLNWELDTDFDGDFSYVAAQRIPITLKLQAGINWLHLQGTMFGWREARLALGLRFLDADGLSVGVPLPTGVHPDAWHKAERGLEALIVRQFAFPTLPGDVELAPDAEPFAFRAEVALPIPENVFKPLEALELPKGEALIALKPGERAELPITPGVTAGMSGMPGESSLMLTLTPADGTPLVARREIWASQQAFSHHPYGDHESRRREALEHLAAMPYDVPAAMAALALGRIERVPSEAVGLACHFLESRYDCADFYAVGLLALLHRFADRISPADTQRIRQALAGFKYWIDEPGLDAMCYFTENHQILFHVSAYLAGQYFPDTTFANSGRSGLQQMNRAYPRITDWVRRRLRGNFSEWDSNAYMTLDAFAMLALVEFARSKRLRRLASTLLHKIFFLLACQSFRGAHGGTHGRSYVASLKSARVENTSGIQRIAFGMGMFNGETRATGLLALAQHYRVPEVIQRIGADVERVVVTRARSYEQFRPRSDMRGDWWDVRTVTYRAPEVMLAAAVDHRPGEMGIQEHLWQATLSPEAALFTTCPGNSQEHGNARPNFWAGSARLPHVTMVGRTVACLYRLEPGVGLGFTHAYFPTATFDEWHIDGAWAFARVGKGYAALWGDGALRLTERGQHAYQELRSSGAGQAWLCYVGREEEDGGFASFIRRVRQHVPQTVADDAGLRWTTPQGECIALRCGDAPTSDDFPHYDNAYTHTPMGAESMTLTHDGESLTLDFR